MEKNNKVMMFVIMGLLVLLMVILGGGFIYVANLLRNSADAADNGGGSRNVTASQMDPRDIYLFPLERAVATNLRKSADGISHLANVSFSVGIDNTQKESEETIALIQDKEPMVRDICLSTMRSMTYDELSREDGMDVLRYQVLNRLREDFQTNLIVSVSISDWYLEP